MGASFPFQIKIGANVSKALAGISRLESRLGKVGRNAQNFGKSLSTRVTAPIVGLGVGMIASAAKIETITVAFESLTGSAELAKKTVEQLDSFTASTPFNMDQVSGSARQLLAAGISTDALNDKLLILGDIAAGANIPLNDMASIFVKIKNKQKAQAEEINQLSERGIPIIQALAKEMNVSEKSIFKLASKGKISFDLIQKSLSNMRSEGGIFANQMEKQSATLAGIFSTLSDNVVRMSAAFGDAIVKAFDLKNNMKALITNIQNLTKWFQGLDPETQTMIVQLTTMAAAAGPLLIAVGMLASGIGKLIGFATVAIGIFIKLANVFKLSIPYALIAAIAWLGVEIYKLINMADSLGQAFDAALTGTLVFILEKMQMVAKGINAIFDLIGKRSEALDRFTKLDFTDGASDMISKRIDYNAARGGTSRVFVDFSNAPPGTRLRSQSSGDVDLNTNIGTQLVGP